MKKLFAPFTINFQFRKNFCQKLEVTFQQGTTSSSDISEVLLPMNQLASLSFDLETKTTNKHYSCPLHCFLNLQVHPGT